MIEFALSVVWMSTIEWVSPISDFFLYAHNWKFSFSNFGLIVASELADFDRMWELGFFLGAYPDLLGGKYDTLVSKPVFWAIGYFIVMPSTLVWAYQFQKKLPKADMVAGADGCDKLRAVADMVVEVDGRDP